MIQIACGIILALLFRDIALEIETEWFLLLFVAPILYNDGRHFPREELWKMRTSIFGNAVILVLITTICGGFFIHWLVPEIPLIPAFALAAILSPTDPVAVNGIAKRIRIPEKVLNLVRGESLINDASGLVAFNYAVAAVVTGYFSLKAAILDFTYMFLAGALLGLMMGLFITWIRFALRKQGINDVTFHSLLQILTPFIIFMVTEHLLHASGVIAVVVAGVLHSLVRERTETMVAEEQVLTENSWSIVLFILNGIVFLLLGLNIPSSMMKTVANPNIGNWNAIGYVIAIGIVILGIRFVWSYLVSFYEYRLKKKKAAEKPDLKTAVFTSLTGVRGAVTMAGVLSIPYFIKTGEAFPERSLILFLAAGVILFTLIAATVLLPLFSEREAVKGAQLDEKVLSKAKSELLLAAIKKIRLEMNEENEAVAYKLIDDYKKLFKRFQPEHDIIDAEHTQQMMTDIRLMALKEERRYIHDARVRQGMDDEFFETFENLLNHREDALSKNARSGTLFLIGKVIRSLKRFSSPYDHEGEARLTRLRLGKNIHLQALQAALHFLEDLAKKHERPELVHAVILDYKKMIADLKRPALRYDEKSEELKEELRIKVMDIQRSKIHSMFEAKEINRAQAKELRRFINYLESITLHERAE